MDSNILTLSASKKKSERGEILRLQFDWFGRAIDAIKDANFTTLRRIYFIQLLNWEFFPSSID